MKKDFKAILFDLDGTLADTQLDLADSTNGILKANHFPTHNYEAYKYLVGKGLRMLATNALPEKARTPDTIDKVLNELIEDYSKNCLNKTALYQGIPELLSALNQQNIPILIFTNKDHDLAVIVCDALLKDYKIEYVLGRSDDRPRKPDPAGALFLADKFGLRPSEVLYVGDTDNDMICASRAGMPSVGVLWGFRTEQELRENGASFIVNKPLEILNILD